MIAGPRLPATLAAFVQLAGVFCAVLVCALSTAVHAEQRAEQRAEHRSLAERGVADDCADQMSRLDEHQADEPAAVEVIVPCAMVESGAFGADCHDAAFYVVNPQGTLLCRVDVHVLNVNSSTDTIEDGPPASPLSTSVHVLPPAAVVDVTLPGVLPPAVTDLAAAVGPPGLDGGREVIGFSPRPS